LYAIDPGGTLKWSFDTIFVISADGVLIGSYADEVLGISDSLAVGSDGTIYVESSGVLVALNTDGSLK
jgi:outer membrane protein assembly factor BamB